MENTEEINLDQVESAVRREQSNIQEVNPTPQSYAPEALIANARNKRPRSELGRQCGFCGRHYHDENNCFVNPECSSFRPEVGVSNSEKGRYTTNCFRRGGAQHRFMFAKRRWSLRILKWWGGWSSSEDTGVIMAYLLDELEKYERNFSGAWLPNFVAKDIYQEVQPDLQQQIFQLRIEQNELHKTLLGKIEEGNEKLLNCIRDSLRGDLRWEKGDPTKHLRLALKHRTAEMRNSSSKTKKAYSNRKRIAEEFNRLG